MQETTFNPELLINRGMGIYLYQEPRRSQPISRKSMAVQASQAVGIPLTLLYRNSPDIEVRNYVLQETERYDKAQAKRQK
jgi:hypothetical protein